MSVSTQESRISYAGNGVTTAFAFPYKFMENAHLVVILTNTAGVDILQTLNSDYTVSGAGNPAGGTVTFTAAPTLGRTVTIYRDTSKVQQVDYVPQDNFPAETHESALDKNVLMSQDASRRIDRTLRIPSSNSNTKTPEMALNDRLNKVVGFDHGGTLDLTVELDAIRTIIIANPVAGLTDVTDYGDLTDPVENVADYGTIA